MRLAYGKHQPGMGYSLPAVKCPLCGKELFGDISARSHLRIHKLPMEQRHAIHDELFPRRAASIKKHLEMDNEPGKVSECCGAPDSSNGDSSASDMGFCPECKEHCDFVEAEEG